MKRLSAELVIVLLAGVAASFGQEANVKSTCSDHPATNRDVVQKAKVAGHGIREQHHSLDLASRPPGRKVTNLVDTGGGDCPSESTPRGLAAAAVGALLYNGNIHCSAVVVSPTMILTAAHCIRGFDENKLEFVLGLDSEKPLQRSPVYRADVHPRYDEDHFGVNDIGYAYLSQQVTEATPIQLPDGQLGDSGFEAEAKFETLFKGRWINWEARVYEVKPRTPEQIYGTCNVVAVAGQKTRLWLWQYPEGCA